MREAASLEEVEAAIRDNIGLLLYFSTPACNVCKALKPKIAEAFESRFPKIGQLFVDAAASPEIAAHFHVFAVPTILIFLDGKEFARASRNVSVPQLLQQIERPYQIMTS